MRERRGVGSVEVGGRAAAGGRVSCRIGGQNPQRHAAKHRSKAAATAAAAAVAAAPIAADCASILPSTSSTGHCPNGALALCCGQSWNEKRRSSNSLPAALRQMRATSPRPVEQCFDGGGCRRLGGGVKVGGGRGGGAAARRQQNTRAKRGTDRCRRRGPLQGRAPGRAK